MIQDGPGVDEYSQHCHVFALLTNTVDLETGKANLLRTMREPGYPQCTVAMGFYLFRALEKTGLYAYTDQYWEVWRNMVRLHCTTCVESEAYPRKDLSNTHSIPILFPTLPLWNRRQSRRKGMEWKREAERSYSSRGYHGRYLTR